MSSPPHLYFCSNGKAPYYKLSNFYHAPITLRRVEDAPTCCALSPALASALAGPAAREWAGLCFPSSEHLWQALKAHNVQTLMRFTTTGDLGQWAPDTFAALFGRAKGGTKMAYWRKKQMIGIVAKAAVHPDRAAALALDNTQLAYGRENLELRTEYGVWREILMLKMRQNPEVCAVLASTGDHHLIEFVRGARRVEQHGGHEHWGALVDAEGTRWGDNAMGFYMMDARGMLCEAEEDAK